MMGLQETAHAVQPGNVAAEKGRESWLGKLRRWLVECPRCAEVWLVVGARENERHVCKDCGHRFTIRPQAAPRR